MASISWTRFREVLKRASRGRARFSGSKTTVAAMVYLYAPIHPDSDQRGLWEICSLASPLFFDRCPRESVWMKDRKDAPVVRGYQAFFWRAVRTAGPDGKPVLDAKELVRALPDALKWQPKHDKRLKAQRLQARKTERQLLHEKAAPFLQDLASLPVKPGKRMPRVPFWRKHHGKGLLVPHHVLAG